MLHNLTREIFAQHLNSKVRIKHGSLNAVELELITADEVKSSNPQQEQFSIVFRGANETPLGQGMYRMEHDQMGEFDIFLVPINRDQEGMYYEAFFNRQRQ